MKNIKSFLFFLLGLTTFQTSAQSDWQETLYHAQQLYDEANFKGAIDSVNSCLTQVRNKEVKADSYRLMAMAYLELHEIGKAEEAMKALLSQKPNYQYASNYGSKQFSNMMASFDVKPKLQVGFQMGLLMNSVRLNQSYSTYNTEQKYIPKIGFEYGAQLEYLINTAYSLTLDAGIKGLGIAHEISNIQSPFTPSNTSSILYNEQQRYLRSALGFNRYLATKSDISVQLGLSMAQLHLLSSDVNISTTQSETGTESLFTREVRDSRRVNNYSVCGVLGLNKTLKQGYTLGVLLKHEYFLNNTMDDLHRYTNPIFNLENHYVNDDISLSTTSFHVVFKSVIANKITKAN